MNTTDEENVAVQSSSTKSYQLVIITTTQMLTGGGGDDSDTAGTTNEAILYGEQDDSSRFIFIPLAVFSAIMVLSAIVFLMARNRRKITSMYKRTYVPSFSFDQSDLEDDNFDDPTECLLSGKLHIDNRYETYQTTWVQNEKRELYT